MLKPLTGAMLIALALTNQASGGEPSTYTIVTAPFLISVVRANGGKANATFGAYLAVRERNQVTALCRWMPVVRDAINRTLTRPPLRFADGRIDLAGVDGRAKRAINTALKTDLVTAVSVFHSGATQAADEPADAPAPKDLRACSAEGKAQASTKQQHNVGDVFEKK